MCQNCVIIHLQFCPSVSSSKLLAVLNLWVGTATSWNLPHYWSCVHSVISNTSSLLVQFKLIYNKPQNCNLYPPSTSTQICQIWQVIHIPYQIIDLKVMQVYIASIKYTKGNEDRGLWTSPSPYFSYSKESQGSSANQGEKIRKMKREKNRCCKNFKATRYV